MGLEMSLSIKNHPNALYEVYDLILGGRISVIALPETATLKLTKGGMLAAKRLLPHLSKLELSVVCSPSQGDACFPKKGTYRQFH